jgi:dTDP-glucose 4,6-dehydratase
MIEKSGREIEVIYTGLRPGEKLTEVLFAREENTMIKSHPLIFHTRVEPIALAAPETTHGRRS